MADKENKNTKPNNDNAAEGQDTTKGENNYIIDTENAADANDPRLDPQSEEFDAEYFKQVYDPQRIADVLTDFKEVLNKAYSGLATAFTSDTAEVIRDIAEQTRQVIANNLPQMQTNFSKTWEAIKDNLPSAEELDQLAMFNYGYQLAIDKLAAANNITVEALIEQSEDADGEAIPGSLGEQAIVFARQFAALMLDELEKEDYQGQTFLSLISEYSQHQEGENRLIVQEGSPLDKAIAAVVKRANSIIDLQLFNGKTKPSPRELAISKGAIISLDGAIATFSSDDLQDAFNSFSLMELSDTLENYTFDETGRLNTFGLQNGSFSTVNDIDTAALEVVLKAVIKTNGNGIEPSAANTTIHLYLPSILKELRIDARGFNKDRASTENDYSQLYYDTFAKKILPFDKFIGKLPNGSYYRVLAISSYDADSQTIVLDTPYMFKALELAMKKKEQDEKYIYLNELFEPNVITERNHAAVELATRITNGLLQRGFTNPKTDKNGKPYFEYRIKFSTLINDCPQLDNALSLLETRQAKNSKLKSTFNAAIKIINNKTHATNVFDNLKFETPYPSTSTLNNNFVVTYTKPIKK